MNLYNNTPVEAYYEISTASDSNCGTIAAGATVSLPQYDNQTNVVVKFSPSSGDYFDIDLDNIGTGRALTVGVYQE